MNQKLSDEDVREIRARWDNGEKGVRIAERFGVTPGHVSALVSGRYRREAGGPIQGQNGAAS